MTMMMMMVTYFLAFEHIKVVYLLREHPNSLLPEANWKEHGNWAASLQKYADAVKNV